MEAALLSASFIIMVSSLNAAERKILSPIIPEPVSIEMHDGFFRIGEGTEMLLYGENCMNSASFLTEYLEKHYGTVLRQTVLDEEYGGKRRKGKAICMRIDENMLEDASFEPHVSVRDSYYRLSVKPSGIQITASGEPGLFYGVQSLIQLLPVLPEAGGRCDVPAAEIEDAPRFPYRGMHLDVVRHIFPVSYVKKYIDYIALHKMNYFHWHLTDDQGWRMESISHPALNEKGAYRDATIIGIFPGTGVDSTRYGGYYTREEIKDIIDYAARRYITVVPEIDIPGHAMAILATYPEFSTDPDRDIKPAITWGMFNRENNVLAPRPEVFAFLEDVFRELIGLFPSPYIHMGADECAHKWWQADSLTQKFISDNSLTDEDGLQKYFAQKVSDIITSCGRNAVGWDEMIDNGLVDDVVVMSWRNAENGYRAAEQGHKVILCPRLVSYYNIAQKENEDSLCHNSWLVTLEDVYDFEPIPDTLSSEAAANILGGQGAMWTEYFPHEYNVEYGIFPRMSAISEVYWSNAPKGTFEDFMRRMLLQRKRYELWGANYFREDLDRFEAECNEKR